MTSLVRIGKEDICRRNTKKLAESVFTIGTTHYHQIGQQFFKLEKSDGVFRYDSHTSQLLDIYFGNFVKQSLHSLNYNQNIH